MSRPLRLEHSGAVWHITTRGNERRNIVRSDRDRAFFVETLADVVQLHRWILHAWVLMSNHYHLLVETPIPDLSRGMKRLNEIYAEYFNLVHRRVGHLVQSRFKGILVEPGSSHMFELTRYIVLNPVRARMVEYAGKYRWSNYRATAGLALAPPWLHTEWTLDQFPAHSLQGSRQRYRTFVAAGRGASYNPSEHLVAQIFLGGEAFYERMQQLIDSKPRCRQFPKAQRLIVLPSFEAVIDAVTDAFDESRDSIRARSHRPARKALAQLGWEDANLTLTAIGEWLGLTDRAVSHLLKRGKQMECRDDAYASTLRQIRLRLGLDRAPF